MEGSVCTILHQMFTFEFVIALLFVGAMLSLLSARLGVPYPALLDAAYDASPRDLRDNLPAVISLASLPAPCGMSGSSC